MTSLLDGSLPCLKHTLAATVTPIARADLSMPDSHETLDMCLCRPHAALLIVKPTMASTTILGLC